MVVAQVRSLFRWLAKVEQQITDATTITIKDIEINILWLFIFVYFSVELYLGVEDALLPWWVYVLLAVYALYNVFFPSTSTDVTAGQSSYADKLERQLYDDFLYGKIRGDEFERKMKVIENIREAEQDEEVEEIIEHIGEDGEKIQKIEDVEELDELVEE